MCEICGETRSSQIHRIKQPNGIPCNAVVDIIETSSFSSRVRKN